MDLFDVETQIQALEEKLALLNTKRQTILEARSLFRNVLSPARIIPADVWNEVFRYIAPGEAGPEEAVPKPLSRLEVVCKAWRSVILDNPILWADLTLIIEDGRPIYASDVHYLNTALQRSGDLPLSIKYEDPGLRDHDLDKTVAHDLAVALLSQAHRWRSANLRSLTYYGSALLHAPRDDLPALEHVSLSFRDLPRAGFNSAIGARDLRMLQNAPRLRSMDLVNLIRVDERHPPALPYAQLHSLSIEQTWRKQAQIDMAIAILAQCTSLQRLVFLGPVALQPVRQDYSTFPPPDPPVKLPFESPITSLRTGSEPIDFLDRIIAPRLEEAVIVPDATQLGVAFPSFVQMVQRSQCHLTLTHIECCKPQVTNPGEFELVPVLRQTVNLEALVLGVSGRDEPGYDYEVVEVIYSLAGSESEAFLPKLCCFDLAVFRHTSRQVFPYFGSVGYLGKVLGARIPQLQKFRMVVDVVSASGSGSGMGKQGLGFERISGSEDLTQKVLSEEEVDALEEYRRGGLALHISVCDDDKVFNIEVGQDFPKLVV